MSLNNNFELLLPVGNREMALAAIHNGANAIYMGFPGYNARGRSVDLETKELSEIIQTCHLYGVKAHLALNIVIFQDELEKLIPLLEKVLPLKPDALIIQDLGLARLIRKMSPKQILHASTQMTITNHEAIALLEDLDLRRFVLGRENSLQEVRLIQEKMLQPRKALEVFVHGALCVSYSGQCFTSESLGGRSANRGQCAQSCRFGYELFVDGQKKEMGARQYLVSPQDLCGIAEIPALMDLGVHSFKVEGRLKSPEYVASAAREFRTAIDCHLTARDLSEKEIEGGKERMATTYSRGFFPGWLHGVDHQHLVEGTGKSHRGHPIGRIVEVEGELQKAGRSARMVIELDRERELSPGDGLSWLESGAQIYSLRPKGKSRVEVEFGNEVELENDILGARIYINQDASQKRELYRSFHDKAELKRIPVDLALDVNLGEPLRATMTDGAFTVQAQGTSPVQEAKTRAVSDDFIGEEMSALGGSVFKLHNITIKRAQEAGIFYPHKELKEIRRQLTSELERLRSENRIVPYESEVVPRSEILNWLEGEKRPVAENSNSGALKLNVLLREKAQVFDLITAWQQRQIDRSIAHSVILDFEFGMDYEPSIHALKEAGIRCGVATTRVLKPREYTNFTRIERIAPDLILVRNLGALHYFTVEKPFAGELRGDFSLNVTNHLTARYLLAKGLASITASYDLNSRQVSDLLAAADAGRVEVTVHQYMPSFHMEHCVFAAFLSKGSSFRDCGKPCEKHQVEVKDQFGNRHHIKPDQECRNTMYNAVPQSAARFVEDWKTLGLGFVRYEALRERGEDLIEKIRGYQDLITGKRTPDQIITDLKLLEKYGLSEGAIARPQEYQSRKKPR